MSTNTVARLLYIIGVVALVAGAIDPLEGSVWHSCPIRWAG